jgi:ATPase family associated with various cellular activities (AAA)
MTDSNFLNDSPSGNSTKLKGQGLLGAGWRPLYRELDWGHLLHLIANDGPELQRRMMAITSNLANTLGRSQYAWWANLMNLFSQETQFSLDEFWDYLTPDPAAPDHRYPDTLAVEIPVQQIVSRQSIPIDYVLNRLQETTLNKILEILGVPDLITQYYFDRYFYLPPDRFISWQRLDVITTVYAYWAEFDVWLQIDSYDRRRRNYTMMAPDLTHLIQKATFGVAVMLSGYQSRVGQIYAQYPIREFPADIQAFTDAVQQAVMQQNRLAVLVHGDPGTGKTAWTQAVAQEVLAPLGYVIFILDHDAVENFVPPPYLERICLIINEADNLAQDRSSAVAQTNNKTEHILSLLDGTLYQSVISSSSLSPELAQKLVVLMTCNTTERLDPAMLRKGRVDLTYEFKHQFV